jgi:hypothetical protein
MVALDHPRAACFNCVVCRLDFALVSDVPLWFSKQSMPARGAPVSTQKRTESLQRLKLKSLTIRLSLRAMYDPDGGVKVRFACWQAIWGQRTKQSLAVPQSQSCTKGIDQVVLPVIFQE